MTNSTFIQQAQEYRALKKWYRALSQRAAVCLILDDIPGQGLSVLMIQRATHEDDPWSGQMAFPGGKQDLEDITITDAGLRELQEEIAVPPRSIHRIGRLSDVLARPYNAGKKPMVVTPMIFKVQKALKPKPNHEVADVVWVPLSLFVKENRQSMSWERNGFTMQLPCYFYKTKRIWGLSLLMIDELVNHVLRLN